MKTELDRTYRVRGESDLTHALWLMKLSYLRYALKTAADPLILLERESEQLHLNPRFKTLLVAFVPEVRTTSFCRGRHRIT